MKKINKQIEEAVVCSGLEMSVIRALSKLQTQAIGWKTLQTDGCKEFRLIVEEFDQD